MNPLQPFLFITHIAVPLARCLSIIHPSFLPLLVCLMSIFALPASARELCIITHVCCVDALTNQFVIFSFSFYFWAVVDLSFSC